MFLQIGNRKYDMDQVQRIEIYHGPDGNLIIRLCWLSRCCEWNEIQDNWEQGHDDHARCRCHTVPLARQQLP